MAPLAHPPPPPHQPHDIPADGKGCKPLTRAIPEYMGRRAPTHPAAPSTRNRGMARILQVNKDLPPLPTENDTPLPEDVERYPPFRRSNESSIQASRPGSHPRTNTTLSITQPPSIRSGVPLWSWGETPKSTMNMSFGTSTSGSSVAHPSSAAFTASKHYSLLNRQVSWGPVVPEGRGRSKPVIESTILTSPSPNPLTSPGARISESGGVEPNPGTSTSGSSADYRSSAAVTASQYDSPSSGRTSFFSIAPEEQRRSDSNTESSISTSLRPFLGARISALGEVEPTSGFNSSTSNSSAGYRSSAAVTVSQYYSPPSRRTSLFSIAPEEQRRSDPDAESIISTSPSTNPLPSLGARISALGGVEPNSVFDTSTGNSSAGYRSSAAVTVSQYYSPSSRRTSLFSIAPEEQPRSDPDAESTISTSPSTNPPPYFEYQLSAMDGVEMSTDLGTPTSGPSVDFASSSAFTAEQYYCVSSGQTSWFSAELETQSRSDPGARYTIWASPTMISPQPLDSRITASVESETTSDSGTSTSDPSADFPSSAARTALENQSASSRQPSWFAARPGEQVPSDPDTGSIILTGPSINPPSSPGPRVSASGTFETNSDLVTPRSGSPAESLSATTLTALQYHTVSRGPASLVSIEPEEQIRSDSEAEPTGVTRPSPPVLQPAANSHVQPEEDSPTQSFISRHIPLFVSYDSDSGDSEKCPAAKRARRPRKALFLFNGDSDPSDSEDYPAPEIIPDSPNSPTFTPPKPDPSGSHPTTPSVPPSAPQLRVPSPPKDSPPSTTRKRKRAEGHERPLSPNPMFLPFGPGNKRISRDYDHHIPSTSSLFSGDEAPSSSSSQSVDDDSTVSAPSLAREWTYALRLTLEELFNGTVRTYRIKIRLLSGESRTREVPINVMPGWTTGTRVIFRNAGNECAPGIFGAVVFVVEQVDHERFRRRDCGILECSQEISLSEARNVNGVRTSRKVVGLDGKVIRFYPPKGLISPGQETLIKGEGMYQRSRGKVVGRGDLIIRWNIKS
ncbi:hypothetical protein FRC01_001292 [Tulasnella sp. 417]|nr:hypothetical protein FRC01_001292 [Tulasnella sp. 417]